MKINPQICIVYLALSSFPLNAQPRSLIMVSPLIGDTLDADEESVLRLFPNASGFKGAVFYLRDSGTIEAEIFLESDNGSKIRVMNVGMLKFLRERIESRSDQTMRDKAAQESSVRRVQVSTTGETQSKPQKVQLDRDISQDKVVVVSDRVGEEISVSERNSFRLFQTIKGFNRAIFYLTPETTYYARMEVISRNGFVRDTVIEYSLAYLMMLSEQVDNFEELMSARPYKMGTRKPSLHTEGGTHLALQAKTATSNVVLKKAPSDFLPLAAHMPEIDLNSYPTIGAGAGIAWFSPDFGGLTAAYMAIEDFYRNQGYNVPRHSAKMDLGHLYWYSLEVGISPEYSAVVEAARTSGDGPVFKMISIFGLYRPQKSERFPFWWYLGLGITRQYFKVVERYVNLISPPQNYKYLDDIISEGAGMGYILEAGIDMRLKSVASIKASLRYLFAQDITAATRDEQTAKVNLSTAIVGIQVMFYF